jgi:hypothetical protein
MPKKMMAEEILSRKCTKSLISNEDMAPDNHLGYLSGMSRRCAKPADASSKDAQEVLPEDDGTEEEPRERSAARGSRSGFGYAGRESQATSLDSELVDTSSWPGTADAAKMAQVHPTTIKNWRNQGRLRAQMGADGNWRHDPDSLAELVGSPETTDPASLLATGMTSIVQQGERANDRILAMTEITTAGMRQSLEIMGHELERAYARIETLEKERGELLDKATHALEANFKHERWLKRIDHEHEMAMTDKRDGSSRLAGLLEILGPIGASIAARVVGDETTARKADAKAIGTPVEPPETIETKVTRKLGDLLNAVRGLEESEFKALRCMLPDDVAVALDIVRLEVDGSKIGASLAHVCKAACSLPRERFEALIPIAPRTIAVVLTELRALINEEK